MKSAYKMDELFIEAFSKSDLHTAVVPLETVITLLTYRYCKSPQININIVLTSLNLKSTFTINLSNFIYKTFTEVGVQEIAKGCILPIIISDASTVIAGVCAVSRQIIKSSADSETLKLLGFRDACLMSPNESSMWTKYCEIDLINTIMAVCRDDTSLVEKYILPEDLARFECHMNQPVRVHNVYKIAREKANEDCKLKETVDERIKAASANSRNTLMKKRTPKSRKFKSKNYIEIPSSTSIDDLNLEHRYAEGVSLTLADVILFPCFYFLFKYLKSDRLSLILPLTFKWYKLVLSENNNKMKNALDFLNFTDEKYFHEDVKFFLPEISNHSLYKSDPKRYKPRSRNFTKQDDIEKSLNIISKINLNIVRSEPVGSDIDFNWDMLPFEALPEGGSLPEKRLKRKTEQLENLAKSVIKISKAGDHIVDFCSGSGHLGIILAVKLPLCKIALLDNKEESLSRAKKRVMKLGLTNVSFYQCNLDFFKANFDIGISLHACGVATDLVIQHCVNKKAHFVCCPCCYGNVHDCHHLTYPRSKIFKDNIELKDYLVIGHAADQTHDKMNLKTAQGELCMDIIDQDRTLHAIEYGYEVTFSKLKPANCTPKNNLLVGIYK